jgi:septal ring factor EnvC (AmiA/AmiB activator)
MKTTIHPVSLAISILIAILLLINLFLPAQMNWRTNRRQTKEVQSSIDSAGLRLQQTNTLLDSLKRELSVYSDSVNELGKRMESLEKERKSNELRFHKESRKLKEQLRVLKALPDSTSPTIKLE